MTAGLWSPRRRPGTRRITGWRKLAGASWRAPSDPQFYGTMDVDAAALLDYVDRARAHTGVHLTVTHLLGRAVAHALREVPSLRVRLAFGREHPRETVDVFFILTPEAGSGAGAGELSGVKVERADEKSAVQLGRELAGRAVAIAGGRDPEFGRTKRLLTVLPGPVLRRGIRLSAWLTSDLNLHLPRLGLPRQAFGGAMVTSVGMWDVGTAYSPLAAYYRVPVLVLVGTVQPRPVARSGRVMARPTLTVTATFDHRYVDGYSASRFAAAIRAYCAEPARHEPPLPAVPVPAPSAEQHQG
ncbi:MAG TPA: 2-oxo acid dehydrogenase subunit E2 [Jatrophihabitans sp.]|nr:2-oxo acid dehydrogenase subunit E2 [Jatrophihabitans sp.]